MIPFYYFSKKNDIPPLLHTTTGRRDELNQESQEHDYFTQEARRLTATQGVIVPR